MILKRQSNADPVPIISTESGSARLLSGNWLPITIIIILNFLCFHRTLSGYFLADDFIHVSYLYDVFNGHPERLLANFTGNWMQALGTQFYRPVISLSLALDYLIGSGKPFVFHLTNMVYQIASSIFLYLLTKRLLKPFQTKERQLAAFSCAAFFAVCPLHPEVVSWIIGRVDSVCLTFYLAAFWLYARYRQEGDRPALWLALASFIISLCSKEMAVTLPATLILAELLLLNANQNWPAKLGGALKKTWLFWLLLFAYFVVRQLALGTVSGGYGGSIGEGMSGSFYKRWFAEPYFLRVIFPFNQEVFADSNRLRAYLKILYITALTLFLPQFILFKKSLPVLRLLLFAAGWFVLSMLPTYQVWNLTESLQCSRFIYAGSAPLSLLLAIVTVPIANAIQIKSPKLQQLRLALSSLLSIAFIAVFAGICYGNNRPWAHASAQVRDFRAAIERTVSTLKPEQKLVIINVPQRLEGAHMLYNGAMLSVLLSPPLSPPNLSKRVVSFEPATFGDPELINISRLRNLLKNKNLYVFYRWNMQERKLEKLDIERSDQELVFDMTGLEAELLRQQRFGKTLRLLSPRFDMPASAVDFIDCQMKIQPTPSLKANPRIYLFWSSLKDPSFSPARCISVPAIPDGKEHHYLFPVSERKSWISGQTITQLCLELPFLAGQEVQEAGKERLFQINSVKLLNSSTLMPTIKTDGEGLAEGLDGIFQVNGSQFHIECDASNIPGSDSICLEISRPNSWFEHYSGSFRDSTLSQYSLKTMKAAGNLAGFTLKRSDFPLPAYYQLRIAALDSHGAVIGYVSDPLNVQISN